mmetsp:Transcript_52844/g.86837  ORF Transcript_52844/g.86837 Transcript_52844/m.86837 type:complete len:84 (+) Transcript_52844:402-653(+)
MAGAEQSDSGHSPNNHCTSSGGSDSWSKDGGPIMDCVDGATQPLRPFALVQPTHAHNGALQEDENVRMPVNKRKKLAPEKVDS